MAAEGHHALGNLSRADCSDWGCGIGGFGIAVRTCRNRIYVGEADNTPELNLAIATNEGPNAAWQHDGCRPRCRWHVVRRPESNEN